MNKTIFLDRDGIINVDTGYVSKIEEFKFSDSIFNVLRMFQDLGYLLIVVTNQAGIARNFYDENDFFNLTDWMLNEFKKQDIVINNVYFCPHHPEFTGECECRKPNPGMLLKAKKEYNIDMGRSFIIGDKESDIMAGINSGIMNTILVSPDYCDTKASKKITHIKEVLENKQWF